MIFTYINLVSRALDQLKYGNICDHNYDQISVHMEIITTLLLSLLTNKQTRT